MYAVLLFNSRWRLVSAAVAVAIEAYALFRGNLQRKLPAKVAKGGSEICDLRTADDARAQGHARARIAHPRKRESEATLPRSGGLFRETPISIVATLFFLPLTSL